MIITKNEIRELAERLGVPESGIVDLKKYDVVLHEDTRKYFEQFNTAIVLGIPYSKTKIDGLVFQNEPGLLKAVENERDHLNIFLEMAAIHVSMYLQKHGYKSFIAPGRGMHYPQSPFALISHKMTGHLAGLGWIGKNGLLINPNYGARIRLITIFTDVQFEPDKPLENRCGGCNICVDACPAKVIRGFSFSWEDPMAELVDNKLCRQYTSAKLQKLSAGVCWLCMQTCPIGGK